MFGQKHIYFAVFLSKMNWILRTYDKKQGNWSFDWFPTPVKIHFEIKIFKSEYSDFKKAYVSRIHVFEEMTHLYIMKKYTNIIIKLKNLIKCIIL